MKQQAPNAVSAAFDSPPSGAAGRAATRVLFVSSEVSPVMKTGGLGEVAGSLPPALAELGDDILVIMPGYRATLERIGETETLAVTLQHAGASIRLLKARLPRSGLPVILVSAPALFGRAGNPYLDSSGQPWPDNAERFGVFARVVVAVAMDRVGLAWRPDVVHCNDWQTGLVPALLALEAERPATLFTVHNLAYQGVFPFAEAAGLDLPPAICGTEGLEFYGQLSFMKGGLIYADRINTVSPTYAKEIQTPEFGCGLDGLLRARADHLSGILNGIDTDVWDPASDPQLVANFDRDTLERKSVNTRDLQTRLGLPVRDDVPVFGMITRLVEQKGVDLVIDAVPIMLQLQLQLVVLGDGEARFEEALRELARQFPQQMHVTIGYDEALSHRITGSADVFLMPSRFEPCGLTQMHSLRYGTPPLVRATGGLADTVRDVGPMDMDTAANGFVFEEPSADALLLAVGQARALFDQPQRWRALQQAGMDSDFTWRASAIAYQISYQQALNDRAESASSHG